MKHKTHNKKPRLIMTGRRARWDKERKIRLTRRYVEALKEVIRAELEMMRNQESRMHPEAWTWGEVTVNDLASSVGLKWQFGGDEDKPRGMKGNARVIIA